MPDRPPPPPGSTDATLDGARPGIAPAADSDVTLPPPKTAPPAAGSPNDTKTGNDVTLAPSTTAPESIAPTIVPPGSTTFAAGDATLTPGVDVRLPPPPTPDGMGGISTGASFGDYQVIETIAKGGMGIVFKARQRKLNRIVAIKMILAGQFADKTDVDRFYSEAEAAAALTHPNIVAIHEIGEVQGQHFFSMDYIEGHSLTEMVRENPLTPRRAAEFTRTIAETMQFAHDRGIVHRDLKPSNVLVDRQQRPLITDFGLAKQVSNQSQITVSGAIVGTPSYMPPEQAEGKGDLIGPRSDIYSLGAILYELVTGRPPFKAASPFETIRQVIQDEPLSPRLVNPGVPKDLETICLKCLQKEPGKRYDTSQDLADELGRFLRGEPINARPISRIARLWRLCKRNPATSAAIALAVLLLVTTAVVSTTLSITTSRALAQSEQSLREAIAAVNDLFTRVSEDTLLNQPGMQPLRKDLLQLAMTYYQRFLEQRKNDPRVQDELGSAYFRVGLITEVLESPDKALPIYETAREMQTSLLAKKPSDPSRLEALGNTLNALGTVRVKQKNYEAAREQYREAVRIRTRLAETDAANSEWQRVLANTVMNLGLVEFNAGNMPAARQQFEQAQKIREAALAADAGNTKLRRDLGKGYFNLGNLNSADGDTSAAIENFKAAATQFEQLVGGKSAELENRKLLAVCSGLLGDLLRVDQPDEARKRYTQASDSLAELVQQNPDVVDFQTERAGILMSLVQLEFDAGNGAGVLQNLEQARRILQPLVDRFPEVPRYQQDLAVTLRELAIQEQAAGNKVAAREHLAQALRLLTELTRQFPEEPAYAEALAEAKAVELAP